MNNKIVLFFIIISNYVFSQDFGDKMKGRPSFYNYLSAPDSLGVSRILKTPKRSKNIYNSSFELPYPIVLIHGLNSGSNTWDEFINYLEINFNLKFGGRFDVSLNDSQDLYTSNLDIYPTLGADIAFYTPDVIQNADLYSVNFGVDINGQYDEKTVDLSNQSAITKQGKALQRIVKYVLQLTNKNKVILMGHSMGGLAAREYLQNTENWQQDGKHHIAKLATTGTPHGGSDAIGGQFIGVDYSSEAIRDLKMASVFLYGGFESSVSSTYYNKDINCDGEEGSDDYLRGLNEKNYDSNVDYSCVIGTALLGFGDGAVTVYSSNWNNVNSIYSDLSNNIFNTFKLHNGLTNDISSLMRALDEPNNFNTAYEVFLNKSYKGFITQQSDTQKLEEDKYEFYLNHKSNYTFKIENTHYANLIFSISDENRNYILTELIPPMSNEVIVKELDLIGTSYFLEFSSASDENSFEYPYSFSIQENTLGYESIVGNDRVGLFPNPTTSVLNFDNSQIQYSSLEVFNLLGQSLKKIKLTNSSQSIIDISMFNSGIYSFKFRKKNISKTVKVIKK